jgi:hypothetical protein
MLATVADKQTAAAFDKSQQSFHFSFPLFIESGLTAAADE